MKSLFRRVIPGALLKQAKAQGLGRKSPKELCHDVARHFDAIVALLEGSEFLVGGKLSIADIAVVSMCTVLDRADEAREMMAARPALVAWRERVDELTLPAGTAPMERALV